MFRAALGSLSLFLLAGILVVAILQTQVIVDLPPVEILETHFGATGAEAFVPVRFYDRDGETVLYEAYNPNAAEARWLYIKEDGLIEIKEHTLRAVLAAVDPAYFERATPTLAAMAGDFFGTWARGAVFASSTNIPQALAQAQLLPLRIRDLPKNAERARLQLLGQEVSRAYNKFKVLEWFVNTADFGHDIYGLDAAALVYLDKHAGELNLAESALLAPILLQPSINPFTAPEESRERQARVLQTMVENGWITPSQAREATREEVIIHDRPDADQPPLEQVLGRWLKQRLGEHALNRSGLVVYTTIDDELQKQAECVLATQLRRLQGGTGSETVPTADGGTCLAASLLPPLRPRDQGVDHRVEEGAFVILDPRAGEILALAGQVNAEAGVDHMISPFIYLTAFSQGYSPGSMILDLPPRPTGEENDTTPAGIPESAHGPVRIRTALANMYSFATEQLTNVVGMESILRIAQNLGLSLSASPLEGGEVFDRWQVSLLDLTYAYGVLAYQGQKVGAEVVANVNQNNLSGLQPEMLFEVEDSARRLVYRYQPESSAVVSPQLAFLLNDILRDETARWPLYGSGNPLEVGRPMAAFAGLSTDDHIAWTMGYSPSIVVGVWMGNLSGHDPEQLEIANSAASVWHALAQYVTRDLPAMDWTIPPGVSSIEVCDPSGLLPTIYCPEVVNEVFTAGTEPITFDNLYVPYRINSETGKLATLFTPVDQVEERIYLIPPPEAMAWAEATGIEQPPKEYDTLTGEGVAVEGVEIRSPGPFEFVRGEVIVSGQARIEGFTNYRLQYGEGLNPTRWVQIGEEQTSPVRSGRLGQWDTSTLDGLYTLQLIVVDDQGGLFTAAVNITIDNQPPEVEIVLPLDEQQIVGSSTTGVVLQTRVDDAYGVDRVTFFIDGQQISTITVPPYSTRWDEISAGVHSFHVQAVDLAGNVVESSPVEFSVVIPGT